MRGIFLRCTRDVLHA